MFAVARLHNRYDKKLIFHFIYNPVHTLANPVTLLL